MYRFGRIEIVFKQSIENIILQSEYIEILCLLEYLTPHSP